jgi:hypothetical protein
MQLEVALLKGKPDSLMPINQQSLINSRKESSDRAEKLAFCKFAAVDARCFGMQSTLISMSAIH